MRKNSARRWLHFILDLLPLVVIPIFAINIINRSPEPISVVVDDTETTYDIQYQYKYQTNDVDEDPNNILLNRVYHFDELTIPLADIDGSEVCFGILHFASTDLNFDYSDGMNDYNLSSFDGIDTIMYFQIQFEYEDEYSSPYITWGFYNYSNSNSPLSKTSYLDVYMVGYQVSLINFYDIDVICKDNSTLNNFRYWCDHALGFPEASTYNVIESATLVETTTGTTTTYNDTDIGSQFLYTLYNAVDKYFNFDNVFNFGQLKAWLGTNLFGGSMPMVAVIVYNVMIYELLMDLMFLLYALFMWFIDMCANLIERCYVKSKGD